MKPRTDRLEQRRKEAAERDEAWRTLTPEEQLRELDRRGVEARRQRARIARILEKEAA